MYDKFRFRIPWKKNVDMSKFIKQESMTDTNNNKKKPSCILFEFISQWW